MYEMNEILKKLGMNYKEFSEHYEIPYNTVRQWAQGTRKPPKYVIKLLNEKIEKEAKGEQLEISINLKQPKYVYCWIQPNHDIPLRLRRFTNEEDYQTDKEDAFWDKRYKEESKIKDVEIYRYTLCNETRIK